jgi:hypothetical protein
MGCPLILLKNLTL